MRVKNFLKPERLAHKDPQVRITGIEALDLSESGAQVQLATIAREDDVASVRNAAIARLNDVSVLLSLFDAESRELTGDLTQAAVDARLANLLSSDSLGTTQLDQFVNPGSKRNAMFLAVHCANADYRKTAIEQLTDESVLLDVVQQSRFHDARLRAAQKLDNHDQMRAALGACRSRDKVVAKMLQQKLDSRSAAEAEKIAAVHAVGTTVTAMTALSTSVWSPQHAGKHGSLLSRWNAMDAELTRESAPEFDAASTKVLSMLAEHDAAQLKEAAVSAAVEAGSDPLAGADIVAGVAADAKTADVETAVATVPEVAVVTDPDVLRVVDALRDVPMPAVTQSAAALQTETGSLAAQVLSHVSAVAVLFDPPFDINKGRPAAIEQRIKRVGSLLNTNKILPGVKLDDCQYIKDLRAHAEELDSRLGKAQQESSDRVKATHRQFAALSSTVGEGKWGPASSMFRRLQKKVDAMEPAEKSTLTSKLQRAEKQLADMADWQDFAARPKLEALCVEMEALPAKELKPEPLSKEIKSLQNGWKELGVSRASNDLWTRFKTAGDAAYEPCKAYFETKQAERQKKIDAKVALCEQLKTFHDVTDWDNADWKAVQRTVHNAKRDWSRNRVPDRKPDRELEQRFSDVLKPLDEQLAAQYDANSLLKNELIEKVQKLAEAEINQHSVNQAKKLQSAWKQVGIMRRKEDQVLWETFNGHCRTIYKHQHDTDREKYQASMSHVFRGRDIIKELKQLSKANAIDEQQVQALQSEFQNLAEFPEKEKKFLLRDFRGAMDACSRQQETASRRRVSAEYEEILRRVTLCEQLEAAVEDKTLVRDTMTDDVKHAWDASDASIGREVAALLNTRRDAALTHIANSTQYDYDKNEAHRRQLLIRMEITAGKETPAEDKALRMQYQLAHLSEGMTSSAVQDAKATLADLAQQWHAAMPVRQSVKVTLDSRFLQANSR